MSEVVGSAIVEIEADTSGLERQTRAGAQRAGTQASRVFGSSFKKNLALVTGGFLAAGGIAGITRSVVRLGKDSLRAAADQSAANAVVARAVKNARAEYTIYGKSIEEALEAESRLSGITDDELSQAFVRLVGVTKNSEQAFKTLTLAEDISRQRKVGVTQAALALARAQGGQISGLRRIIPGLREESKELSKQENIQRALAQVQKQFGGGRVSFAGSDAGQLERASVALGEIKESLGTVILPIVSRVAQRTADWLAETENQQKVLDTIDKTARTIEVTTKGLVKTAELISIPFRDIAEDSAKAGSAVGRLADRLGFFDEGPSDAQIAERTQVLIRRQQLQRLEDSRGRRFAQQATQPLNPTVALDPLPRARTGTSSFELRRLRAASSATEADDLRLFRERQSFLQGQIDRLEDGVIRGRGDRQRLEGLYGQIISIDDEITRIEDTAREQREAAAEERKRVLEEEKAKREEERRAAAEEERVGRERARTLRESRLQLRVQKAELTSTSRDDIAAQKALVRYYGRQAVAFRKNGAELRSVEAQAQKVSAQLALRGLRQQGQKESAGGGTTDFFQTAADQFRQFGSNIAGRGGVLSGQDARGAFAGMALARREDDTRSLVFSASQQLGESVKQTTLLAAIASAISLVARDAGSAGQNVPKPRAGQIRRDRSFAANDVIRGGV